MKKYYQLLLIIISLVSLISVIIYRNEYNRLRYVLEVLNFFGKPDDINCVPLENITITNKYNIPPPAWHSVDESHFIYSAFWNKTRYGGIVKAIGVSTELILPSLLCKVWFMEQAKPVMGKFSIQPIVSSKNKAYYCFCRIDKDFGVPYRVDFYKDLNKVTSGIPIFTNNVLVEKNKVLACVKPDATRNPAKQVEFINFHQVLGITSFIIYDNGALVPGLTNFAIGLDITVLSWNLPIYLEQDLVDLIIETDCFLRAQNTADILAVLNWNELIVPNIETSISSLVNSNDPFQNSKKFQFQVYDFCTDFQDEESKPKTQIIFHKLHYKKSKDTVIALFRPNLINDHKATQKIFDPNVAIIQRYIECFKINTSNKLDRFSSILRFNTDFVKTSLYQLWIKGNLIK